MPTTLALNEYLVDEMFITIIYNPEHEWLYVNWVGDQDEQSIKDGCARILALLKEKRCRKVLNDNRGLTSRWSDASEWVGRNWFPEMLKAGLEHFAWVYPSDFKARLSMDLSVAYANDLTIATYDDICEAKNWLMRVSPRVAAIPEA